ncbi:MAG: hypothetical protein ACHQFZ_01595 [Acidimicrobiales bacterium]
MRPHGVPATISPTCKTVPASLFATDLGLSMVTNGGTVQRQLLSISGQTVRVGGKPITVQWQQCGYAHSRTNLGEMNLTLSYLAEQSATRALVILRAMCSSLRPVSTNFSSPAIDSGACLEGHTGVMQNSTGLVAVKNVVVFLFGSQSPTQTLVLLRGIARIVAKVKPTSGSPNSGSGPQIAVTSNSFTVANGFLPLGLSCSRARCSGVAQLSVTTSTGMVVLASTDYMLAKSTSATYDLALTAAGVSFFAPASVNPIAVTLTVTAVGGNTVSRAIQVYDATPPTLPTTTVPG